MIIKAIKTSIYTETDELCSFIIAHLPVIEDGSIIVITSKIVAVAEGRVQEISELYPKEYWIKKESTWAKKTKYVWLTLKDNMLMASAGIDESNANNKIILLPEDSFQSADQIRKKLLQHYHIKNLGVLITDSRTAPLRAGVVGVALGYAGFRGIRDYRGSTDIFGRELHFSRTNVADSLATAAVFLMGEGREQCPLAVIQSVNIEYVDVVDRQETKIDVYEDMYAPFYEEIAMENISHI